MGRAKNSWAMRVAPSVHPQSAPFFPSSLFCLLACTPFASLGPPSLLPLIGSCFSHVLHPPSLGHDLRSFLIFEEINKVTDADLDLGPQGIC